MPITQCGGIKLDGSTLKTIEGVICEASSLIIDPTKLITTCGGQQWDGDSFKVTTVDGKPIITYAPNGGEAMVGAMAMNANCGVGVDKRFFTLGTDKTLSLVSGFLLIVNTTPADATITVLDSESQAISPISGTTNQFIATGTVSVTVERDGYEGKSQTVNMNDNKTLTVALDKVWTLTVEVDPADATVVVEQSGSTITPTPVGSRTYVCHELATTITASKTGYTTATEEVTMTEDKTVSITLQA